MRVGAADERRRVDELDAGDVLDAGGRERGDLVAGAGGDAEDAGVVAEEAEAAEGEEDGGGEGLDLGVPVARGPKALVLLVEGRVGARGGEVAGGFGEAKVGLEWGVGGDAGVGGSEEEEEEGDGCYGYGHEREPPQERVYFPVHFFFSFFSFTFFFLLVVFLVKGNLMDA